MTSRTIAPYSFSVASHRPSGPSAATSTAWPSSCSARLSSPAIRISSSTTSTRTPARYEPRSAQELKDTSALAQSCCAGGNRGPKGGSGTGATPPHSRDPAGICLLTAGRSARAWLIRRSATLSLGGRPGTFVVAGTGGVRPDLASKHRGHPANPGHRTGPVQGVRAQLLVHRARRSSTPPLFTTTPRRAAADSPDTRATDAARISEHGVATTRTATARAAPPRAQAAPAMARHTAGTRSHTGPELDEGRRERSASESNPPAADATARTHE